jgi:hypothetical protein
MASLPINRSSMPSSHSQAKLPSSSVTSLNAAPGGPSSKLPPRVRRWSTYALGLLTPLLPGFIVAVHYLSPMTQFFRRRPLSSWPYTFPDPYYECRADEAESWCEVLLMPYSIKILQ